MPTPSKNAPSASPTTALGKVRTSLMTRTAPDAIVPTTSAATPDRFGTVE
jgi:hypothetical protein